MISVSQERLAILAVVFTMALGLSLTLSPAVLTPYGVALAVLAAAAVPYLLHGHPAYTFSPARLVVPAGIALAAPFVTRAFSGGAFLPVGVFGPGVLLYGSIYAEFALVRPLSGRARMGRLILALLAYAVALAFFLIAYQDKERTIISGPIVALASGLLSWRLLLLEHRPDRKLLIYAAVAGLGMGEITWALNYWLLSGISGGILLLLSFYVIAGLLRHLTAEPLAPRVLAEYSLVGAAGALIAIWSTRI
ncbi:MAG: DUF5656 family protein [Chloroflexota bacterium]